VDRFLQTTSLRVTRSYRRGEARTGRSKGGRQKHKESGFTVAVSNAPWARLKSQIDDAERFLLRHRTEIARLSEVSWTRWSRARFPDLSSYRKQTSRLGGRRAVRSLPVVSRSRCG